MKSNEERQTGGVQKLESEILKLTEQLNLSRETEKLKSLREKETQIKKELEALLLTGKQSEKLERAFLEVSQEIFVQEKRIKGLSNQRDEKVEVLRLESMAQARASIQRQCQASFDRVHTLESQLRAEVKKLVLLYHSYEKNILLKRHQISSNRFVEMEREKTNGPEKVFPPRIEKLFIEFFKVSLASACGWRLVPGQDLTAEPLDSENSISLPVIPIPEIVDQIRSVSIAINFFDVNQSVSSEDILNFLNELQM